MSGTSAFKTTALFDDVTRPVVNDVVLCNTAKSTSSALVGKIVTAFDIEADPVGEIPADDVTALTIPRTLGCVIDDDDAGGEITGTVTIIGKNHFGRSVKEECAVSGTDLTFVTKNAFIGKPRIILNLAGTEASDVLDIGQVGFGIKYRSSTDPLVTRLYDDSGATVAADAGTYDAAYGTYLPDATVAAGDQLFINGFQDTTGNPPSGDVTLEADTSF